MSMTSVSWPCLSESDLRAVDRGPDRMIQRAEQANIVGLRSKDFVQWVEQNIDAPMKRGPGGAVLERLKAGLVGEFFNWAKRNSTWPLVFGIMCCAIEMAATSDPRYDVERFGVIYRSSPRQCDVLLLNGPISLKLRPAVRRLYEQMAEPKWVIAMGSARSAAVRTTTPTRSSRGPTRSSRRTSSSRAVPCGRKR